MLAEDLCEISFSFGIECVCGLAAKFYEKCINPFPFGSAIMSEQKKKKIKTIFVVIYLSAVKFL